jgi:hypothetical protein
VLLCVIPPISSTNFTFFFKRGSTATFGIETAVLRLRPWLGLMGVKRPLLEGTGRVSVGFNRRPSGRYLVLH